jgi:hypothetical protein
MTHWLTYAFHHGSTVPGMGDSMIAGFWNDARLFPPPKDGSSYLLLARIDVDGERPWPIVGHWDSVLEWRSSAGEPGLKLVDISHWMAIPEIPVP